MPDKGFNRFFAQTSASFWHLDAPHPGIFGDLNLPKIFKSFAANI